MQHRIIIAPLFLLIVLALSAKAAVYTPNDISVIDKTLTQLEADSTATSSAPIAFSNALASPAINVMSDLYGPQKLTKWYLNADEVKEYRLKPRDYRLLVMRRDLGEARLDRIKRTFLPRLSSLQQGVRRQAIWVMTEIISDKESLDSVRKLLTADSRRTRIDVAVSLAKVNDSSGRKVLEDAMNLKRDVMSLIAADALRKLGVQSGRERLLDVAVSTSPKDNLLRHFALMNIQNEKGDDVEEILLKTIHDKNLKIAQAALNGLSGRKLQLQSADIDRIFELIDSGRVDIVAKSLAFHSLLANRPPNLRERLLKYRNAPDLTRKRGMLQGMIKLGKKKDVSWIVPYLDDKALEIRRLAEVAIWQISGVKLGNTNNDLNRTISKRKKWWKKHKNDPEYQ